MQKKTLLQSQQCFSILNVNYDSSWAGKGHRKKIFYIGMRALQKTCGNRIKRLVCFDAKKKKKELKSTIMGNIQKVHGNGYCGKAMRGLQNFQSP